MDKNKLPASMANLHTHYDNLKVARDAPPEVIRAAYKTLCHKFHPDRHADSETATRTFQLVNTAYEVLSNPASRLQHDVWIEKQERVLYSSHPVNPSAKWNGRERRRRFLRASENLAVSPLWGELFKHIRQPNITGLLWASIGMVGIILLLLHPW